MRIEISTEGGKVTAAAADGQEIVIARGDTLTEAIENLVLRFGELRMAAIQELRDRAFIRHETETEDLS